MLIDVHIKVEIAILSFHVVEEPEHFFDRVCSLLPCIFSFSAFFLLSLQQILVKVCFIMMIATQT